MFILKKTRVPGNYLILSALCTLVKNFKLKGRIRERERRKEGGMERREGKMGKKREREKSYICWFMLQWLQCLELGWSKARSFF